MVWETWSRLCNGSLLGISGVGPMQEGKTNLEGIWHNLIVSQHLLNSGTFLQDKDGLWHHLNLEDNYRKSDF